MSNSDNPKLGADFQKSVLQWFIAEYKMPFSEEIKLPIGSPLNDPPKYKLHKFDIVSDDHSIVIECKRHTWTKSLNVPSAKMGFVNEAVLYLSLVKNCKKFIVMLRSYNPKRQQTLAEYYYQMNSHLLGDIIVAEFDPETKQMRYIDMS